MIQIQIENVDKIINQTKNYVFRIRQKVSDGMILFGDQIVEELKIRFPDLTFTGQFFSDKIEYWITITQLGEKLTEIKCPQSNLFFVRKRDEYGKQGFRSDGTELNEDETIWILDEITDRLSLQINQIVRNVM